MGLLKGWLTGRTASLVGSTLPTKFEAGDDAQDASGGLSRAVPRRREISRREARQFRIVKAEHELYGGGPL